MPRQVFSVLLFELGGAFRGFLFFSVNPAQQQIAGCFITVQLDFTALCLTSFRIIPMNELSNPRVIALLTDFGTRDYFVGAMKGVILSINPRAIIVDITHDIAPQNIAAASFNLRACLKNFPARTIFVAVVDPGVGSHRKAILVETADYFFIAPDNGLLSFIFRDEKFFKVYELTERRFFAANVSSTFHGRDVFAPAAAHLSTDIAAALFGAETKDYIYLNEIAPRRLSDDIIEARIIHADHFGNLITNLTVADVPEKFQLKINEIVVNKQLKFFAAVGKSELAMIFGSAGFLEIIAFQDSAQRILKAEIGQSVRIETA